MAESTLVRSDGAASTDMLADGSEEGVRCVFVWMRFNKALQMLDRVDDG